MASTGQVASKIVAALNASEPGLDTSVGTPARKIIDAVSESIAEAYADAHLINYQYDIDTKTGGDLDDFVALFGFTRLPAQRAQGTVSFTRPDDRYAATTALVVAPGTQVVAQTNPVVYVQTTVGVVFAEGQLNVEAPVQAVVAGPQGNVAAGLLTQIASPLTGVATVINEEPMVGGAPQESDAELRERFKNTVFRSLAGTQSMYQAIAQAVPQEPTLPLSRAVSAVNVLGSSKRYREQIEVVSGTATSSITDAAFIFPDNVFCGSDIDAGNMLTHGSNYSFVPTNPTDRSDATATLSAVVDMPDGFYDLEFEYVPQASRNDPGDTRFGTGGINNRVDVWVNGIIAETATQSVVFTTSRVFSSDPTSPYYQALYRADDPIVAQPDVGNYFLPLAFGPVLTFPEVISVGGTTYERGIDFWVVERIDAFGMGPRSLYGLMWQTTRVPAENAAFSVSYTYNRVAHDVQEDINRWRLVGTDAVAHCGLAVYIEFNLAVVYERAFDTTAVSTAIDTALAELCSGIGFAEPLQVSDVLQTVHNVPGVDNVRFLTNTDDPSHWAMGRTRSENDNTVTSFYSVNGRVIDASFGDHEYPVFHSTNIDQRAANTFWDGAR